MSLTATEPKQAEEEVALDPSVKEMIEAGVFYGRTRTKTHPKMKPYVLANRNGVEIINVQKTVSLRDAAAAFLKEAAAKGKAIMIVATQPAAHETAKALAAEFEYPIVTRRWLGGTLTNYRIISRRVEYWKKLKSDLAADAFKGYTKKEQLDLKKEAAKLDETLTGLEAMMARPEVLVVVDPAFHRTGVLEARRVGVPVVALMNTDSDPLSIEYPVIGNTKARTSINWFIGKIAEALREGKKEGAARAAEAAKAAEASRAAAIENAKAQNEEAK